jgi:hypothetical protein
MKENKHYKEKAKIEGRKENERKRNKDIRRATRNEKRHS